MIYFETQSFRIENISDIDSWLNKFSEVSEMEELTQSEYNYDIVGYVVLENRIIITVKILDLRSNK